MGKSLDSAESIFRDLPKILKSTIIFNPELKVFVSTKDDIGENFTSKRMFNYIVEQTKGFDGNEELRRLNDLNKYKINFPVLRGYVLEEFLGYKRLK